MQSLRILNHSCEITEHNTLSWEIGHIADKRFQFFGSHDFVVDGVIVIVIGFDVIVEVVGFFVAIVFVEAIMVLIVPRGTIIIS